MTPIVCQSCSSNMFNHWVAPSHCRCCSFLGNMGGSTNPVAQLTLPSHIVLKSCKIHWRNLTRFDKIAIQNYKFQMASGQGSHWLIDSPTIVLFMYKLPLSDICCFMSSGYTAFSRYIFLSISSLPFTILNTSV